MLVPVTLDTLDRILSYPATIDSLGTHVGTKALNVLFFSKIRKLSG